MSDEQIITTLREYNSWRRGVEGEQPDPKSIGYVIEEATERLGELHNNVQGLCEHFDAEGIVDLGVKLLRLERERDAERALADSLGNSISRYISRYLSYAHNDYSEMIKATEAWKEARND